MYYSISFIETRNASLRLRLIILLSFLYFKTSLHYRRCLLETVTTEKYASVPVFSPLLFVIFLSLTLPPIWWARASAVLKPRPTLFVLISSLFLSSEKSKVLNSLYLITFISIPVPSFWILVSKNPLTYSSSIHSIF